MPVLPSAAALSKARQMHQAALEAFHPGTVTIGGVAFAVALHIGPFEPKLLDDGINFRIGQDATFTISKEALPAAPEPKSDVTILGNVFRVVDGGNQGENETAWRVTARRYK